MYSIEEEIKEVSSLIKKYPKIKEFYLIRAKLYEEVLQYVNALNDYKKATDNYLCMAVKTICKKYNLVEEVEKIYKKEIKANKNNYRNYISRAYFYIDIGKKGKALKDYKTALKLVPKNDFEIKSIKELIKKIKKTK